MKSNKNLIIIDKEDFIIISHSKNINNLQKENNELTSSHNLIRIENKILNLKSPIQDLNSDNKRRSTRIKNLTNSQTIQLKEKGSNKIISSLNNQTKGTQINNSKNIKIYQRIKTNSILDKKRTNKVKLKNKNLIIKETIVGNQRKEIKYKGKMIKNLINKKENSLLSNSIDETCCEETSTNLELIESDSNKLIRKHAYSKKFEKKKNKQVIKSKRSYSVNNDYQNLMKTFEAFMKFCRSRFDNLEEEIKIRENKPNNRKPKKPNSKKFSFNDKLDIKHKISLLNKEEIKGLFDIIKSHSKIENESQLEFDLNKLPNNILSKIKEYVDFCFLLERENFSKDSSNISRGCAKVIDGQNKTNQNIISKKMKNIQEDISSGLISNKNEKIENIIDTGNLLGKKRNNCIFEELEDLSESLCKNLKFNFNKYNLI